MNSELHSQDEKMKDYESNFSLLAMNNKTVVNYKQSDFDFAKNAKNKSIIEEMDDDD